MSAVSISPPEPSIGEAMRQKLAGFAHTLRHNGFKVGLAETRDALAILAGPPGTRAALLRPALRALFCATHSDWDRFDEIFDAVWLNQHMRQARTLASAPHAGPAPSPSRRLGEPSSQRGQAGLPDRTERRNDTDTDAAADGRSRREGASRAENLAATDMRHIVDPAEVARAHALAARLARTMRARLVRREQVRRRGRRLDLRRTIHRNVSHGGTLLDLAWRRRKIKPLRLVMLLDASGSMSLYVAFFVRFLHAWSTPSARPRPSCFTPASPTSRRRCATAT